MGMALAGGIAMALNIPVTGVCSLAAIASAIEAPGIEVRFVVRDARRGELFCAAFTDLGQMLIAPSLVGIDLFDTWLSSHAASYVHGDLQWALAGDGLRHLDVQSLTARGAYVPENAEKLLPDARQTAMLGARTQTLESVKPNYVREADVILPSLVKNSYVEESGLVPKVE